MLQIGRGFASRLPGCLSRHVTRMQRKRELIRVQRAERSLLTNNSNAKFISYLKWLDSNAVDATTCQLAHGVADSILRVPDLPRRQIDYCLQTAGRTIIYYIQIRNIYRFSTAI